MRWQTNVDVPIYKSIVNSIFGLELSDCCWYNFNLLCALLPNMEELFITFNCNANLNESRMNNILQFINGLSSYSKLKQIIFREDLPKNEWWLNQSRIIDLSKKLKNSKFKFNKIEANIPSKYCWQLTSITYNKK